MDLGLKTEGTNAHASLLRRLNTPPGQHGTRGKRKTSEYGLQLREKQRARRMYGIMEKQFQRYFTLATRQRGATGEVLLQLLENRLDNVIYRLGLAPTRTSARQLVGHGHVLVDGKKVNIPSFAVCPDQVVSLKTKSLEIPIVKEMLAKENPIIPGWLQREGPVGKMLRVPKIEELHLNINEQLIVEFYSR